MNFAGKALALALLVVINTGCSAPHPAQTPPVDDGSNGISLNRADGQSAMFRLILKSSVSDPVATGSKLVETIELQEISTGRVQQRIDTTDTELLYTDGAALELVDLNFDGHIDIRYPLFRTAGPNRVYRHWRWDEATTSFAGMSMLDEIGYVNVDKTARELVAEWRDGRQYGSDTYRYEDGKLVRLRNSRTIYSKDSSCVLITTQADGSTARTNCE